MVGLVQAPVCSTRADGTRADMKHIGNSTDDRVLVFRLRAEALLRGDGARAKETCASTNSKDGRGSNHHRVITLTREPSELCTVVVPMCVCVSVLRALCDKHAQGAVLEQEGEEVVRVHGVGVGGEGVLEHGGAALVVSSSGGIPQGLTAPP